MQSVIAAIIPVMIHTNLFALFLLLLVFLFAINCPPIKTEYLSVVRFYSKKNYSAFPINITPVRFISQVNYAETKKTGFHIRGLSLLFALPDRFILHAD